jgi:hypothetical protein
MAASMKMTVFSLMVEAVRTSETSIDFYDFTRRNIPEHSHLHTLCYENLKYQLTQNSPEKIDKSD